MSVESSLKMLYLFYLQSQKHQRILIKVTFLVIQINSAFNKFFNNPFFTEEPEESILNFIIFPIYKDQFVVIPFEF